MEVMKAMPEFITRQDIEPRAWSVEEGAPVRGDAWTEMRVAKMRVPFGADDTSRVVRAHELMHAKVSPINGEALAEVAKERALSAEAIVSAEEFRVNMLLANQGFDVNALSDGSESKSGKIIGENGDWNGMIRFMASTAGTKAGADFIRGMKTSSPEMAEQARELQKVMNKFFRDNKKRMGAHNIANTRLASNGLPDGFNRFTIPLATLIQSLLKSEGEDGEPSEHDSDELPKVKDVAKGKGGMFARLIEKQIPKPRHIDGKLGRKRIATNIGRNPRRINRMLTDPEMRIFDRHAKGKGGVVLIDQSGSMRLSNEDIDNIIAQAPGCVIIGYSHQTKSTTTPNVWVIADRGKVAESVPEGNGGNGVDGPAIRFAQAKRRNGEPFIWVCDGYVTDGTGDSYYENLGNECASLVVKHNIHMVNNVEDAVSALRKVAQGQRLPTRAVGPLVNTGVWLESIKD